MLVRFSCIPLVVVGGDLAKIAASKKLVEAKYGLKDLSKRQSWVFPKYLIGLQTVVRGMFRALL